MQWLWESYQISSQLYTEVEKSNKLDEDYYKTHIGIIQTRIDQAGIRLAGILNDFYSGKVFSSSRPAPVLPSAVMAQSGPAKTIEAKDAAAHLNETVTITAKVYGTKDVGSMILVNVGAAFPDSPLTVVLRGDTKSLQLEGKTITVTGQLIDYKGKPEIIVTDKARLSWK